RLERVADEVGVPLEERLPVYPQYVGEGKDGEEWVSEGVKEKVRKVTEEV
ncbi:MAG: 7,8-didemethyl-8-hydroxy-5-deazariboflavin synthase subunit CofG, partial [Halobacteria archaeon]|nr:7,8-didemethyl-8-hydroxy-5-deazariboflavin synthase subunit CofG [Halobacteria archaeon]